MPAGTFDMILAGNVIQFLPRPAHAVRRWLALLKPGGTLGFSWGLAQDPRWEPVMATVDAHVPAGITGFEAFLRRLPFGGTEPVERMLTSSGFKTGEGDASEAQRRAGSEYWRIAEAMRPKIRLLIVV